MLLDTHAWIEFFLGSDSGETVRDLISKEEICTSIISISEICMWCLKNNRDINERLTLIKKFSTILDVDENILKLAAEICFEKRKLIKDFGLMDAIIYATSLYHGLTFVTGDKHFNKMENVVMV